MLKQLPSGLVIQDKPEPPKPKPPSNCAELRPGEFVAEVSGYRQNLENCIRAIHKCGGTVLSVVNLRNRIGGISDDRWVVIYEAREQASWEELC